MVLLIFLACTYLTYGQCELTKNKNIIVQLLSSYSVS